jgi:hypothetical protein
VLPNPAVIQVELMPCYGEGRKGGIQRGIGTDRERWQLPRSWEV